MYTKPCIRSRAMHLTQVHGPDSVPDPCWSRSLTQLRVRRSSAQWVKYKLRPWTGSDPVLHYHWATSIGQGEMKFLKYLCDTHIWVFIPSWPESLGCSNITKEERSHNEITNIYLVSAAYMCNCGISRWVKVYFSHCLPMVELRPSSSVSTGCVVPLKGE